MCTRRWRQLHDISHLDPCACVSSEYKSRVCAQPAAGRRIRCGSPGRHGSAERRAPLNRARSTGWNHGGCMTWHSWARVHVWPACARDAITAVRASGSFPRPLHARCHDPCPSFCVFNRPRPRCRPRPRPWPCVVSSTSRGSRCCRRRGCHADQNPKISNLGSSAMPRWAPCRPVASG